MSFVARRATLAIALFVLLLGTGPSARAADEIEGTVVAVTSGDTLRIEAGGRLVEVRLADVGAPQGSDFYAPAARTLLAAMVSGKSARVTVTGRFGTEGVFGRVRAGEMNVNLELVRRGAAWMCLEYATDTGYLPYQSDAQRHRRGLWSSTTDFDAVNRCRQRPPAEHRVGKP